MQAWPALDSLNKEGEGQGFLLSTTTKNWVTNDHRNDDDYKIDGKMGACLCARKATSIVHKLHMSFPAVIMTA